MKFLNVTICTVAAAAITLSTLSPAHAADEGETKEVKIQAITLKVPPTWTQKPASNRLRLAEFQIKPAEGEGESELVVYSFGGGGGGVQANIERWIKQFDADGRKASVVKGKSTQGEYVLVDIRGTYNMPVGPPIRQQTKPVANARMLAVILNLGEDNGNYFLKLTGGEKTVTGQEAALRNAFGADKASEKPLEDGE